MDAGSPGGKLQSWVMEEFASQDQVSRGELVDHMRGADLPDEVRDAIAQMPEGSWSKETAVHRIVDVLEVRAGGGARGEGNAPGQRGLGVQVDPSKPGRGGSCRTD